MADPGLKPTAGSKDSLRTVFIKGKEVQLSDDCMQEMRAPTRLPDSVVVEQAVVQRVGLGLEITLPVWPILC
jgi:hypothetical protein